MSSPDESKSKLAEEISKGVMESFLSLDFGIEAVEQLIYQDADFYQIEKEMKKVSDWKNFDRYLRGYRGY